MFKQILNAPERTTHELLREVCSRNSAEVFAKVRVADILPIDDSGISNDLFRFALQSHFDFVVGDKQQMPLFAVEFDGPTHRDTVQIERDSKKDSLCDRFGFPMLRINAEYINREFRNLQLLTWFVEVWFFTEAVEQAQESGALPADDYFSPFNVISIPGLKGRFPLFLSLEPRLKIQEMNKSGIVTTSVPSVIIGKDENGTYRGLSFIRMGEKNGVFVSTEMTSQRFSIDVTEALHEILPFLLHQRIGDAVDGDDPAVPWEQVNSVIEGFRKFLLAICSEMHCT